MDLRLFIKSEDQRERIISLLSGYQPFIVSDNFQTGEGYMWCTGRNVKRMDRTRVSEREWRMFVDANQKMRNMYDDFISTICEVVPREKRATVLDSGCNDGYFLYSFLLKGATAATGFDLVDRTEIFQALNKTLGVSASFVHTKYDSYTHRADGITSADLVISCAVMCHLSDPLYYLSYLAELAHYALFIFSTIDDNEEYYIRYEGYNYYWNQPYPLGFDKLNHISSSCIYLGLRELGFKKIIEIPYRRSWLPWHWYRNYKALIALRD